MKKLFAWIKEKVQKERAVVVGFAVTAIWWVSDVLVAFAKSEPIDWGQDLSALIPLATGLVISVFVTSDGVKPGWRRKTP